MRSIELDTNKCGQPKTGRLDARWFESVSGALVEGNLFTS